MLDALWYDLRHAFRSLIRSPRNSAIAAAILGLGIGATTAMFSAINHVLLRPLPFPDADRLIRMRDSVTGADGQRHAYNMSSRNILALRSTVRVFDDILAMSGDNMTLDAGGTRERVSVVLQTDGFERTLAIKPALGRGFTAEEQRNGIDSGAALVSYATWQGRFGGTPGIVGHRVTLDRRTFTIVGVMPPQYAFPYEAQFWVPFVLDPADQTRDFAVWGRMSAGATRAQVRDALDAAAARIREQYVGTLPSYSVETMTMRENIVGVQDAPIRALTWVVVFLLLIACVNVATLLLARSVGRRREFAVRAVLGASGRRHVLQLLAESLVLAAAGCFIGLLLAAWAAPLTASLIPTVLRGQLGLVTPQTDWRVALFAIGVSVVSAAIAAVLPAWGSWRTEPQLALSDGGRTMTAGRSGRASLGMLVIAETALTLVLLAGAGLIIRNFVRLQTRPLGFDARGLVAVELAPTAAAYPYGPGRAELARRIVNEVQASAGVESAAITTVNPLGGGTWGASVVTEEVAAHDPTAASNINHRLVTPTIFGTMRIRLLQGRGFTDEDRAGGQRATVVSDRLARRFWPGSDPIGKRIRIARPGTPWQTVVGVVADVNDSHEPDVPLETWYLPLAQNGDTPAAERFYIMVRGAIDAGALTATVQRAVERVDRTLTPYHAVVMDAYYRDSIARERVSAAFMLAFGAFGLVLAALGVYGVMAFTVAQRTGELGIRMALGAHARDILPLVMTRALGLISAGLAAGVTASAVLNRILASLLTEVGALDLSIVVAAALLILITAVAACVLPAAAAARLDPVAALKNA